MQIIPEKYGIVNKNFSENKGDYWKNPISIEFRDRFSSKNLYQYMLV